METKCPYCGEELTKGFLKSPRYGISWLNEDAGFIKKHTIFGGEPIINLDPIPAYRCYTCDKIIFDAISYKQTKNKREEQENDTDKV